MIQIAKEVMYVDAIRFGAPFLLAGDIGGTNSNFGIFSMTPDKAILTLSVHFKSKDIQDFSLLVKQVVDYVKQRYDILISTICIGAAGIVYPHRVSAYPTNLTFEINVHEIEKLTNIADIMLINDFEAVALGIDGIDQKDCISINKMAVHHKKANIGFIGAGTGLGKSILVWNRSENRYFPVASEGGHADASFEGDTEYALHAYMKSLTNSWPISWEMLLSGAGIQKIYAFLGTQKEYPETESTREIAAHDFNPDRISFYAEKDQRCKDTFNMYVRFYARCAKNFALDSLSLNGIYIAGGIASKNISMFFEPTFLEEFIRCSKQIKQLNQIPVYIIADYNISLYGAVIASRLRDQGKL